MKTEISIIPNMGFPHWPADRKMTSALAESGDIGKKTPMTKCHCPKPQYKKFSPQTQNLIAQTPNTWIGGTSGPSSHLVVSVKCVQWSGNLTTREFPEKQPFSFNNLAICCHSSRHGLIWDLRMALPFLWYDSDELWIYCRTSLTLTGSPIVLWFLGSPRS